MLRAEDKGVDVIFGYDHFHWPAGTIGSDGVVLDELEYRVIGSGEVDAAGLPMGRAVEFVVPLTVGLQGYPD